MVKVIAITGVGGFIGNELANYFLSQGKKVIGLNRSEVKIVNPLFSYRKYKLEKSDNDFSSLKDADVIIHCAFMQWNDQNKNSDKINIDATLSLAEFCERNKKQFVFLSSFSAHEKATSHYGKHKFELENTLKGKHFIIKPGLVIGKKGMFANISKIISERKFIPIIDNGRQPLQWVSVQELCKAIENGIEKNLGGVFYVASEESVTFLKLNESIARQNKKSPFFVFVHPKIAELFLKIIGKKLPFTKENLDGLLQLQKFNTAESLKKLEITISPLEESLNNTFPNEPQAS